MPHILPFAMLPGAGQPGMRSRQQQRFERQLPRWHPDQELPVNRLFVGQRLGFGLGLGLEAPMVDVLSRLETLLTEMKAARATERVSR